MVTKWTNWAGNQSSTLHAIESPASEEEIASIVKRAETEGLRVKAIGSGHSFTDIAATNGILVDLKRYDRVVHIDEQRRQVTVEAGISLHKLSEELASHGLAMENMGDIAYQSIAGAISTATHGTGIKLGNIATQVRALSLVLADGSVLQCSEDKDSGTFRAAQVGLGALGILSTVTLQCLPAFVLRAVNEPRNLDECLAELDESVDGNDHFEFFWFPHTDTALTKTNNRTDKPAKPRSRSKAYVDDILMENRVFELVCRLGKMRSSWTPSLSRTVARTLSKGVRTDRSDRIFATPRLVRFVEMEYAIPRRNAADAIRELRSFIDSSGLNISFPVEVRFVAPDDIFLSPAHGRETCYIAIHMFRGIPFEDYFRSVEKIMDLFEGRPHWGKMHFQTAETLAPRYPQWTRFAAVRALLDPAKRFDNDYLDRVLGRGIASGPSSVQLPG